MGTINLSTIRLMKIAGYRVKLINQITLTTRSSKPMLPLRK